MSVQEITKVYEELTPILFASPFPVWNTPYIYKKVISTLFTKPRFAGLKLPFFDFPLIPYSREPLEVVAKELVKDSLTYEFNHEGCIAGAVAREYNEDAKRPDILRLFDSESDPVQRVLEVLLASSNAPFYFKTPSPIGKNKFIDGGVGGMKFLFTNKLLTP